MENEFTTIESVKNYYGKVLQTNQDLKTSACCTTDSMPLHLREILKLVHDEVKDKFYGCGSPIPTNLEGKTVLDIGSGSGRDCFLMSKLVGANGKVIGVDMTDEQLSVARKHEMFQAKTFGYASPNTQFLKGYIEDLGSVGIASNSIDVVTSNCVINLSPNKERVFKEIFRVLKPGGELYFSDVFSNRRLPAKLKSDPVLVGECLGGALYVEDFRRMLSRLGCLDYRLTARSRITLHNEEIAKQAGFIEFYSMTVRAFKLELEDRCEDFGQTGTYLGTIPESPNAFVLDDHHTFESGKSISICGNTAMMLKDTRYSKHFVIQGDTSRHFGLFDCAPGATAMGTADQQIGACC